jgi:glycosyltransferase involved in cell wall biosynthesis
MDLTVLISTWNSAKRLGITLDAFKNCEIPAGLQWHLVIVNNNCTDNTDEVVARYDKVLPITYVKEPQPGLSQARNTGLQAATGKLIIFTDDDVKPCREWIKIYWDAYRKDPNGKFWGGPIESEFEGEKPDEELLRLAPYSVRGLDYGPAEWQLPEKQYFISANWAAPLAMIREVGGFDVRRGLNPESKRLITGEESDLMDRLRAKGLTGLYLPGARLQHFVPKEKCTLGHIVARCEAGALEHYDKYRFRLMSTVWFNKPVGIYLHAVYHFLRFVAKRLTFRRGSDDYIKFRIALTVAKAFEQKFKGQPLIIH